jgi:AmmeMemoRadiSam system protein B
VASTDLTHYEPDATVRKKDRDIIEAIIDLDEEELVRKVRAKNITMCGEAPVAIFIACLKKLGAHKAQVALYQTSGDKSGDYSSVVGYVGMIVK